MNVLTTFDLFIFSGSLILVMGLGLWAGRKEEDSEDYFLAGRNARWWGVAGSIFGSNVSANHIVGMMGVGFSVGFAQSHFEISAIFGLLLLCYGFLPVYRKLNLYTLSEYMSRRYDDRSRVAYAIIMVIVIVVIQMVPGFYIGSRSLNILLQEEPGPVDPTYYKLGIVLMALVTGTYTIIGGLKAVIVTDVLQSILMLVGAVIVGALVFSQAEIGGWGGMREIDAAADAMGQGKMHLYLPADHGQLPWTGVLSGLMILHFYYWGTNQFIVQRALAARSDREARLGIILAGFFKLLIPFMSIGGGIAAFYLFRERGMEVAQDAAFTVLLKEIVAPVGFGVVGLVAAGLIGAILSSLDSMMNSGATIVTMDFYKRYINPDADEHKLVLVGRIWIAIFLVAAAVICIFTMDPNSKESFFLHIASHQSKLIAGVVVAFALGMFWKRATAAGAIVAILAGVACSYGLPPLYAATLGAEGAFFGEQLNFMHSVFLAAVISTVLHVTVSLMTQPDAEKSKMTWTELGGHDPSKVKRAGKLILIGLGVLAVLAILMAKAGLSPAVAGGVGGFLVFGAFLTSALDAVRRAKAGEASLEECQPVLWKEDRFWAGLLCGTAVFLMYYFY